MARIGRLTVIVIVSVFMAIVALIGGAPAGASTFSGCDSPLVDQTNGKVLDASKVRSAITAADKSGVDLYVRAFQTVPDGSLDQYWQDGVQKCANWRSGSGSDARPKGNVALVAFSLDRKSAIFYGPVYDDLIGDTNANKIRTEMGSFFRNGDFTGGVTYAAGRIGALASGNAAPANQPAAEPSSVAPAISDGAWASFWSVVWKVLLGIVILVALILAVVFALKVTRQRREERAALAQAKADAVTARKTAGGYVTKWSGDTLLSLDNEIELELIELPESRQAAHRREAKRVTALLNDAMDGFGEISRESDLVATATTMTRRDYERETARYDGVNARFRDGESQLADFRKKVRDDVAALSPAKQAERIAETASYLERLMRQLDGYATVFSLTREKEAAAALKKSVDKTADFVRTADRPDKALAMIEADERGVAAFKDTVTAAKADSKKLADPVAAMRAIVDGGRRSVRQYSLSNDKAEADLNRIDEEIPRNTRFFSHDLERKYQIEVLDRIQSRVDTIVKKARKDYDEETRKRRDREAQVSRRRRPSYSGGSSGSDAFGGGLAGGFIGGSLGSSWGSSGSSDSGGGWGGGSSGGFDGGGSSGGGDSGGW